ncbi:MAG: ParB/RepB/Spo0J family partition protein [Armatimonadetes bacterium]|nr:ParB/RepB/Spo0J family partition protein [Armatimonadota bacterium]
MAPEAGAISSSESGGGPGGGAGGGGRPRRGLGRGLAALIPGASEGAAQAGIQEIPTDNIVPGTFQPRGAIDGGEFEELVASVREHGILQPIIVRPRGDKHEVVVGERRWRAAVAAGLRTVPAVVRSLTDRETLEIALVENLQREDLTPLERAKAYHRLSREFGLTQEQVAQRVGVSRPAVANTLRLLGLPVEVQASLEHGRITEGHARALLMIQDRGRLLEAWRQVEKRGFSVREAEVLAQREGRIVSRGTSVARKVRRDPEIVDLEEQLRTRLGTQVRIRQQRKKGEIVIEFYSVDDLTRIIDLLLPVENQ